MPYTPEIDVAILGSVILVIAVVILVGSKPRKPSRKRGASPQYRKPDQGDKS